MSVVSWILINFSPRAGVVLTINVACHLVGGLNSSYVPYCLNYLFCNLLVALLHCGHVWSSSWRARHRRKVFDLNACGRMHLPRCRSPGEGAKQTSPHVSLSFFTRTSIRLFRALLGLITSWHMHDICMQDFFFLILMIYSSHACSRKKKSACKSILL